MMFLHALSFRGPHIFRVGHFVFVAKWYKRACSRYLTWLKKGQQQSAFAKISTVVVGRGQSRGEIRGKD